MSSPLDRVPEAVVVLDHHGVVREVNDRAARVLAVDAGAVGRPLGAVLRLEDDTGRACDLPPPAAALADRSGELLLRVVGQGRRPVAVVWRWHADGVTLSARPAGARDAMDRVHGDVVATVSHELRGPLSSVKGFTRTLLARWDRVGEDDKLAMLRSIDADADRLARLIRDLLEVSRIDAGRVRLQRAPVDLGELATVAVERLRAREELPGDRVNIEVDEPRVRVHGDRDRLAQVLDNLLDNAVRHGAGQVEVRVRAAGAGVEVVVADDGPGIPAELRRRVFHKFGRGRDSRRPGTGLGLFIARGLVEAHGGRLTLEAREDRRTREAREDRRTREAASGLEPGPGGAVFHCWLPAAAGGT